MLTLPREVVGEVGTGKTAGECFRSVNFCFCCFSQKLPRFLFWKLFRKCEKVNAIADDLLLRKSVWEKTEQLIGRALDSPSALP